MTNCLPITEDDSTIRNALSEAHLPSLIAALVHITGDTGLIHGDIKPVYDFFGDGQGGLAAEQQERVRSEALAALKAFGARGSKIPAPPSNEVIRELMDFVAGAKIPDHYVPFLLEELSLQGGDAKAGDWGKSIPDSAKKKFHVLVIGAGMSGVLAAIRLKHAGIPFPMVDKNADVGGTWCENTYPGCRVDNPNHLYSYSFEPNYDWPQHYSTQDMLWGYFRKVAEKYGIRQLVRFDTEVIESVYDEKRAMWTTRLKRKDGHEETIEANAIISAVGQLNRPKFPDVKGIETFKGASFHSSNWNHSLDLKGKRVAVVGTGASAFQFVPAIAPDVAQMYVFQRSAPWLGPTPDYHHDVAEGQKWLLKHVPFYAQWYRFWLFWMLTDGIYAAVQADPEWKTRLDSVSAANDFLRDMLTQYIQSQSGGDETFFKNVTPAYPPGGKRTVRDNGVWLAALRRPNVELVVDPIAEVTPKGIKTKSGKEYDVDVIIYGTGFHASRFLSPMKFKG